MKLIEKVKAMFGIRQLSGPVEYKPDVITARHKIAIQRNERASRNAQEALEALLARNDDLREHKK